MLTFYSSRGAPNPRRVEVFMAEHGLFEGQVRSRSQPSPALAILTPTAALTHRCPRWRSRLFV